MSTFEGLRLSSLEKMQVGEMYVYYHEELPKNGISFYFTQSINLDDRVIYIGEKIQEDGPIGLDGKSEQENLDAGISALYLLSELKDANERTR